MYDKHSVTLGRYPREFDVPCETGRFRALRRLTPWLKICHRVVAQFPRDMGAYANFCCFVFESHTASTPITAGTYTDGGAVIRKPGSAWLEDTPAISIVCMFCFMIFVLK